MPALPGSDLRWRGFQVFLLADQGSKYTRNVVAMKTELSDGGTEALSHRRPGRIIWVLLMLLGLCVAITSLPATEPLTTTNSLITQPLSRAEAINMALRQNPNILRA